MSFLVDKYNIINTNLFDNTSEQYSDENIVNRILTDNRLSFDLEKIAFKDSKFKNLSFEKIIKNHLKEYKQELNYIIKKNKSIEINKLTKKFFDIFEKIKLISLMLNRDIVTKSNDKPFGNYPELNILIKNMCSEIIMDEKVKNNLYKTMLNDKEYTALYIKMLSWFDNYNDVSNNFLKGYSSYISENNNYKIDGMKHIELYMMYQKYQQLKKYFYVFNKNDSYLYDYKVKMINLLLEIIQQENSITQEFIISNPNMIREFINITEKLNYQSNLFLSIFISLEKNNFVNNNLNRIFSFVSDLSQKMEQSKKNFIKKTIMNKLMEKEDNITILVDNIIYGKIKNSFVLELININDMVVNYLNEILKNKITPLIINNGISMDDLLNIILFLKKTESSNFLTLTHDLEIIMSDYNFSKKFTDDINDNFKINTNNFIVNPNFWGVNHSEGHVEFNSTYDYNHCNNINNIYQIITSSYKIVTEEKRRIYFLAHIGSVSFDYQINDIVKKIKMLPIQSMVFQSIYDLEKTNYNNIIKNKLFSNYTSKFIEEVIDSLIEGGIILLVDGIISINSYISKIEEDYVELIFNEKVKTSMNYEPVFDKTSVINCWINKIVKSNNSIEKNTLFKTIVNELNCGHIIVSEDDFNKSFKYMIEHDYIEEKDGFINKLIY